MSRGLFVTGTDTGAGKTIVAAALVADARRRGLSVAAFKPVVTGVDEGPAAEQDDAVLARAAGDQPDAVTPHRFGPPMSPHLAAALAGTALALDPLVAAAHAAGRDRDLLVVEGVGGLLVPLTESASVRDLARTLGFPLVVAARPGLGTINHTLLTLEAARAAGLHVAAVVLTPWPERPDAIAASNRATIARLGEVEVAVLGRVAGTDPALLAGVAAGLPADRWVRSGSDRPRL